MTYAISIYSREKKNRNVWFSIFNFIFNLSIFFKFTLIFVVLAMQVSQREHMLNDLVASGHAYTWNKIGRFPFVVAFNHFITYTNMHAFPYDLHTLSQVRPLIDEQIKQLVSFPNSLSLICRINLIFNFTFIVGFNYILFTLILIIH